MMRRRSGSKKNANMVRIGLLNAVAEYCADGVTGEPQVHVPTLRVPRYRARTYDPTAPSSGTAIKTIDSDGAEGKLNGGPAFPETTIASGASASEGAIPRIVHA